MLPRITQLLLIVCFIFTSTFIFPLTQVMLISRAYAQVDENFFQDGIEFANGQTSSSVNRGNSISIEGDIIDTFFPGQQTEPSSRNLQIGIYPYNADENTSPWDQITINNLTCNPVGGTGDVFTNFSGSIDTFTQSGTVQRCGFVVSLQIRNDFNCNPNNPNENRCKIIYKSLERNRVITTLDLVINEQVSTDQALTISLSSGIYKDVATTIAAQTCLPSASNTDPTIQFRWWESQKALNDDALITCLEERNQICGGDGTSADPELTDGNGAASIQKSFDNPGPYHIQAYCNTTGIASYREFTVLDTGNSASKVTATAIDTASEGTVQANSQFKVEVSGLETGPCYYIRVQDPNGQYLSYENPSVEGGEQNCGDLGDIDDTPYVTASNQWGANNSGSAVVTITASVTGPYLIILERARNNEGWRNDISKGFYAEMIGAAIGGFITSPGIFTTVGGAAIGAGLANRAAVAIGNSEDQVLDQTFICSGFANAEDCARFPDPKNPPCANNIDMDGRCYLINTSLGFPINVTPEGFIRSILGILLSISGIIALLLIIKAGYQFMTSNGNPETVQAARDTLTSAIVGLIFIIFSLVILQLIAVDILRLPGFGN